MGKNKKFVPHIDKAIEPEVKEKTAEILDAPVEIKEPEVKVVKGVVDGVDSCLNIRIEPAVKENNQIAILGKGTTISVVDPENPVESDGETWYKVIAYGKAGFAMKKYIKIVE